MHGSFPQTLRIGGAEGVSEHQGFPAQGAWERCKFECQLMLLSSFTAAPLESHYTRTSSGRCSVVEGQLTSPMKLLQKLRQRESQDCKVV